MSTTNNLMERPDRIPGSFCRVKRLFPGILIFFLLGVISSCTDDDRDYPTTVPPVTLSEPSDNTVLNLNPEDTDPVVFSWHKTRAEDGSLVFYKVLFDREDGDFSQPLVTREPNSLGIETSLELPHIVLDSLIQLARDESDSVRLKWTVLANSGIESSMADPYSLSLIAGETGKRPVLMSAADGLMDSVVKHFLEAMPLDIWGDYYPRRSGFWDGASTVWGQGAAFSGYAALKQMAMNDHELKYKYESEYDDRLLTSIDRFRNTRNGKPEAYAVFPGGGDERYYDDNVWIGIDMVDLYDLTHKQEYLDRAEMVWEFILDGTDNIMGGGVYWKEGNTNGKNTCATAPAAILGLKLYEATGDPAYLDQAKDYYEWVRNTLQDPSDHLYWDNVKLADPENPSSDRIIDKSKFTYNSGTPMQAAVLLYNITGESHYLDEAREIATAAYNRWFKPYYSTALGEEIRIWSDNNLWFNAVLLRGYIELYKADKNNIYVDAYKKIMLHAWWSEARNEMTGLLDTDFKEGGSQTEWKILYQGACIEMMARLADLEEHQ